MKITDPGDPNFDWKADYREWSQKPIEPVCYSNQEILFLIMCGLVALILLSSFVCWLFGIGVT